MSDGIWIGVAVAAVLLGIFRPRWLLTILCILLAIGTFGFVILFCLVIVAKLFGSGKK